MFRRLTTSIDRINGQLRASENRLEAQLRESEARSNVTEERINAQLQEPRAALIRASEARSQEDSREIRNFVRSRFGKEGMLIARRP